MPVSARKINLVLSGGGVKGIAYIGAFQCAEDMGYIWENIAGVSSGALVGSYAAAGYRAAELHQIMSKFDFAKVEPSDIPARVKAVSRYLEFAGKQRTEGMDSILEFLGRNDDLRQVRTDSGEFLNIKRSYLKNVIAFSKEGSLYDGDYLEEWVENILARRGIKTFADLKFGKPDAANPEGYKVRMTAVDANRAKVIVLPDDISFYGISPDKFEVAKAVRMSISVPFAFKPVEIAKKEDKDVKTYHIVDGGVFDNFPFWIIDSSQAAATVGFRLDDGKKGSIFSLDTPINILKALITAVHDIGIPKGVYFKGYLAGIDTSKVPFLEFNLNDNDKEYLINQGRDAALKLFNKILPSGLKNRFGFLQWNRN